jgi:hypothetical protein
MATQALAPSKMRDRLARLQSQAINMREAAKVAAARVTVFVFSGLGGLAAGYLDWWAERTGRKLTIGTSTVRWPMLIGIGVGLVGALAPKLVGEQLADVALGGGSGMVAGELALSGRRAGLTAPAPSP